MKHQHNAQIRADHQEPQQATWSPGRPPIGSLLKARGLITEEQLLELQHQSHSTGKRLGQLVVEAGLATEVDVALALAEQSEYPFQDLGAMEPDPAVLKLLPREVALQYGALPIRLEAGRLLVAPVDPYDVRVDEAVRRAVAMPISLVIAPERQVRDLLQRCYGLEPQRAASEAPLQGLVEVLDPEEESVPLSMERLAAASRDVSVIRVLNSLLSDALAANASDIHIYPTAHAVQVRYRIDGVLRLAVSLSKDLARPLAARVKVLSSLDIAESRHPQDGGCRMRINNSVLEVRASTLPGLHGESIVLRLLNQNSALMQIDRIGLTTPLLTATQELLHRPHGMLLVTGPTGSGKTTTVYALVRELLDGTRSVLTVEDPVEYEMPGARQVQVNEKAGINFSTTLRSMLRHDPDVLVVGEIRDSETAEIAVRAAITGHLIISTLHTNYAAMAPTRLFDMSVPPYVVAASLNGVIAQRLVRLVCAHCSEEVAAPEPLEREWSRLGSQASPGWRRGAGCSRCYGTGTRGRTAVHELLVVDEDMRALIADRATAGLLFRVAREKQMRTLFEDAVLKAGHGLIPPEEALAAAYLLDTGGDGEEPPHPVAAPAAALPSPEPLSLAR